MTERGTPDPHFKSVCFVVACNFQNIVCAKLSFTCAGENEKEFTARPGGPAPDSAPYRRELLALF